MKKISTLILATLLIQISVFGQDKEPYGKSIIAAFETYQKAVMDVDFEKIITFAHPNIVKVGGGSTYYVEEVIEDHNMYRRTGLKMEKIEAKQPSRVLDSGTSLQAMLPYVKTFTKGEEVIKEEHFYLITSVDEGKSWSFTDMKKYDVDDIKLFIPDYNDRLNIYINSIKH